MSRLTVGCALVAAAAIGVATVNASAGVVFGFGQSLTNNSATNVATASQYTVEVSDGGAVPGGGGRMYALFTFRNSGPAASSITDVYFQDGTLLSYQDVFAQSAGVEYSQFAHPANPPGGSSVGFTTQTSIANGGFFASADSNSPVQPMGVNPNEWVTIRFQLLQKPSGAFNTWLDTVQAMQFTTWPGPAQGALRIAIKVQGFDNGGSETFMDNPVVPLPPPSFIAGVGLLGLLALHRRRLVTTRAH